jgi:hypothetical protein
MASGWDLQLYLVLYLGDVRGDINIQILRFKRTQMLKNLSESPKVTLQCKSLYPKCVILNSS